MVDAVFADFERTARWPVPMELDRRLRHAGRRDVGLIAALADMPRELGWREGAPPVVKLSLFGIGCAPAAAWLLERYVELLRLALRRYENPAMEPRVSRALVVEALGLDAHQAEVLSAVVLQDCPFLGGGRADPRDWCLDIDERVTLFEHVKRADDLLQLLARQRGIVPAAPAAPARRAPEESGAAGQDVALLLAVVGVCMPLSAGASAGLGLGWAWAAGGTAVLTVAGLGVLGRLSRPIRRLVRRLTRA
ncbi:MAG TPA: hypothetical protein VFS37_10625 [Conexibacter sp.]|nr:hypothetical protein [Conexibacter sp.]